MTATSGYELPGDVANALVAGGGQWSAVQFYRFVSGRGAVDEPFPGYGQNPPTTPNSLVNGQTITGLTVSKDVSGIPAGTVVTVSGVDSNTNPFSQTFVTSVRPTGTPPTTLTVNAEQLNDTDGAVNAFDASAPITVQPETLTAWDCVDGTHFTWTNEVYCYDDFVTALQDVATIEAAMPAGGKTKQGAIQFVDPYYVAQKWNVRGVGQ